MEAPEKDLSRLIIESITDYAIYMLDVEGKVVSWNPGAARLKGYTAPEIIGQHFSRFYTEEDRKAGLPARVLDTARQSGRFEGEGWRIRKDGSKFWVNVIVDPVINSDGKLIGYAKVTRDLTERKGAEDALRRSEEQFRLLVQSVTDYAIFMLSPTGIVTNWNAGAQRIKGYEPHEIIGQHFSRFYSEEDRAAGLPQQGLRIAETEGRFEREAWRYRKDGTRFWAHVVIDPIFSPTRELLGFAKITRDMTERREAALAVERAREVIAQSQKMEAVGQLTGGIAHDFNNLLMAVLGSLELMRKRLPDDPKLKLLLNNAFDGARRGVSLTQRMLSFARRQDLAVTSISVDTLISGMLDLLDRSLGPMYPVEVDVPENIPNIRADINQLETALLNLALNARDAMPRGGTITIAARVKKNGARRNGGNGNGNGNGECIVLSVTDTGEGMDATTLARATEPFFTTKGVGKGTGLGLSMVHGMAEQLGGYLRLDSAKGRGTTAEIWLPVDHGESAVPPIEAPRTVPEVRTEKLTIVVVDDDALVLVNTSAMLEDFGHTVIEASSGAQALDLIRRTPHVDLVITDQAMPQMTGVQLAAAIRVEWPEIKVLLVSGYAELPAEVDIPKLAKPFSLDDLESAVSTVMRDGPDAKKLEFSFQ